MIAEQQRELMLREKDTYCSQTWENQPSPMDRSETMELVAGG